MTTLSYDEVQELRSVLRKVCYIAVVLNTSLCGVLCYVSTAMESPWAVGIVIVGFSVIGVLVTMRLNKWLLYSHSEQFKTVRRNSRTSSGARRRRTTLIEDFSNVIRETGQIPNPLVVVSPAAGDSRRSFERRRSSRLMTSISFSTGHVVAVCGAEAEVPEPSIAGLTNWIETTIEALEDICRINEGSFVSCAGGTFLLSFPCLVNAVRVAISSTKLPNAQNFPLTYTSGIASGRFVKGGLKGYPLAISGAAFIASRLADVCTSFHCTTIYAGHEVKQVESYYIFMQVDLITFANEATPVYSVMDGVEGDNSELAVMWLHMQEGDLYKGMELLKVLPRSNDVMAAMHERIGRVIEVLEVDNCHTYSVLLRMGTGIEKVDNGLLVTRTNAILARKSRCLETAFLVLQLGESLQDIRYKELVAKFTMFTKKFGGNVEFILAERLISRWTITTGYRDICECVAKLMDTVANQDISMGFGLATGEAKLFNVLDVESFNSTARSRAECHAMVSVTHSLGAVVDKTISHQTLLHDSCDQIITYWRPLIHHAVYKLPFEVACEGLAELSIIEEVNGLYTHALLEMKNRMWGTAKEFLQKYNDVVVADMWAVKLQTAVTKAETDETKGIRSSDDNLVLSVDQSGARFSGVVVDDQETERADQFQVGINRRFGQHHIIPEVSTPKRGRESIDSAKRKNSTDPFAVDSDLEGLLEQRSADRKIVRRLLGFHGQDNQSISSEFRFRFAEIWNAVKLAAVLVDCFLVPSRLIMSSPGYTTETILFLVLGYICDCVYFVDIVLNFREPVTNDRGIRITSPEQITEIYLHGWFITDLIACLPWELFFLMADKEVLGKYTWVRLNRMLNLARFPGLVQSCGESFMSEESPVFIKIVINLCMLVYVLYWTGVVCNIVTDEPGTQNDKLIYGYGWSAQGAYFRIEDYDKMNTVERNLIGFHWAIRGFAGYGQPWPITDKQTMMCIILVVAGIAIFATVIAYLQTTMKMTHNEVFLNRLDMIVAVAEHRRLDEPTTSDILKYHRMLWSKTKQVYEGQFDDLKEELPEELVGELSYFANIRAAERVDILRTCKNPMFLARIVSKLSLRFGAPGEVLVERGQQFDVTATGIYFIFKGKAIASVENTVWKKRKITKEGKQKGY